MRSPSRRPPRQRSRVMEMKGVTPTGGNDAKGSSWPNTLARCSGCNRWALKPGREVLAAGATSA